MVTSGEPILLTTGKMLDGSCATHIMKGIYSDPVQPAGTFCPLIAKKKLLGFKCTNEDCDLEVREFERNEEGEHRYRLLHKSTQVRPAAAA